MVTNSNACRIALTAAPRRLRLALWLAATFLVCHVCTADLTAVAQSHRPAHVIYLVRDEKGEILDPKKLEAIVAPKGQEMKADTTFLKNADGTTTDDVKCLESKVDVGGRPVSLSEMTLKLRGQTMRLIFNVTAREERILIDSLPFQAGTFKLSDKKKWTKVKDDAPADKPAEANPKTK